MAAKSQNWFVTPSQKLAEGKRKFPFNQRQFLSGRKKILLDVLFKIDGKSFTKFNLFCSDLFSRMERSKISQTQVTRLEQKRSKFSISQLYIQFQF